MDDISQTPAPPENKSWINWNSPSTGPIIASVIGGVFTLLVVLLPYWLGNAPSPQPSPYLRERNPDDQARTLFPPSFAKEIAELAMEKSASIEYAIRISPTSPSGGVGGKPERVAEIEAPFDVPLPVEAVSGSEVSTVEQWIAEQDIGSDGVNVDGYTLMHLAAAENRVDVMKELARYWHPVNEAMTQSSIGCLKTAR